VLNLLFEDWRMRSDPFRKDVDGTADLCSAMVAWSGALCGNDSPDKAIRMLGDAVGAQRASLYRLAGGASRLLLSSLKAVPAPRSLPAPVSFASMLIVAAEGSAQEGQVVRASDFGSRPAAGTEDMLVHKLHASRLREVILIVLEIRSGNQDVLELHFADEPAAQVFEKLCAMAPALVAAWSSRLPGTATRLSQRLPREHGQRPDEQRYPLLSAANPARLTRSEFRVCILILEGLSPKAIAEALDVQLSTVYAHLRAACAKTGTGSQLELVHRLVEDERNAHHRSSVLSARSIKQPWLARPAQHIDLRPAAR
jgi:DNA-binding CsgD family transcriptional regulator